MPPQPSPTLVLLAGPNGAGKSTLYETRIAPSLAVPFINADNIQRDELQNSDPQAAYKAAEIATQRRDNFLHGRVSFATETVFSHVSKLDLIKLAKDFGFRVMLFHISVETPDLTVARVSERVKEGGHPVPEHKIRERYDRNGPLIRKAALLADTALVFDNSTLNVPPKHILTFQNGAVRFVETYLPEWALKLYETDLER